MAADPLVPVKTPFNYNLGINYETFVNGRNGRSITADLDEITKNFGLIKTFHDVANPGGANPIIDPDQQQVISYVAQSKNLQLVMGTYTSALAQGGYGAPWSGPGSMTSAAYTDKWVQMLVTSFGSTKAVKDHLKMIVLGNEVDQAENHPPDVNTYMGWFRSAFDNLSASLKKAGLGSIAVTTTIAAYTRTDAGAPIAVGATKYIYDNWRASWNGGEPVVMFNDYTPSNSGGQFADPNFKPVIDYYKELYSKLGSHLAPFVGETGYSSFYTLANEIKVYNQIKTWLNGQYNNNARKTIPLFIFNAFDQPSKGGLEQQFGIYADNPNTHRPTGLKTGLTLPSWSRSQIKATATDDRLHGTSGVDALSGGSGDDWLKGGAGNDQLAGGVGADLLEGGAGDDVLKGGEGGVDVMIGGNGNDTYFVNDSFDIVEEKGNGYDRVSTSVSFALAADQAIDFLSGRGRADLTLIGNQLDNSIWGSAGNDILVGGAGYDILRGKGGADTLTGGADNDILEGGAGADRFNYSRGDGNDSFTDFSGAGGDRVALTNVTVSQLVNNIATLSDGSVLTAQTGYVWAASDFMPA